MRKEGRNAFQTDLGKRLNVCRTEHLLDETSEALQSADKQDEAQPSDLCTTGAFIPQCLMNLRGL